MIHFISFGPGDLHIPILLYHHFSDDAKYSRYTVSPQTFAQQLQWLYDNGYHTVSIEDVITALKVGKELPENPIVITIDDGNADVYNTAFPLMKQYNFTATVYLIAYAIGSSNMLDINMIQELRAAGWDFGSHSFSHVDLTSANANSGYEICTSKKELSEKLGMEIRSFAYPYGLADEHSMGTVFKCGYLAGMGLGSYNKEANYNLFYLPRREVQRDFSMEKFQSLLTSPAQ